MVSIRWRLTVLFVILVTVTLGAFGLYAHSRLSAELEQRYTERQTETLVRLKTSLPTVLWNYDKPQAERILLAEVEQTEVVAVKVSDVGGQTFASVNRNAVASGAESSEQATVHHTIKAELVIGPELDRARQRGAPPTTVGTVEVLFSRDHIDAALRKAAFIRVLEIVLVDAILVVALTYSLTLVFKPMGQLRDALFDLAAHEGEDAEELPETSRNEFGDVIRGFNLTQRKLRQVMQRRVQAEEAARAAAAQAEGALRELQAAQESLEQSEKLAGLGGLVAGVAHEVNTPIGVVLTGASVLEEATVQFTQALRGGSMRKSDVQAYARTAAESAHLIHSNAERAAHLIQSFKQVAVDQTSDQRRCFHLRHYLDELMTSLHASLRKAHASAMVQCDPALEMDSYPGLLAQVLTNLTMNAIIHAFEGREGGRVQLAVEHANDWLTLMFTDNGPGISEQHLGRIFEPFFTTRRGQGGTGLGLHIVYNIVTQQLGGTITVHNQDGGGACFTICIPRVAPRFADAVKTV